MTTHAGHASLFTPEILQDPYPLYHRLRTASPVYWAESLQGWLVTRYDDVAVALRDLRLSSAGRFNLLRRKIQNPDQLAEVSRWAPSMLSTDPPAHTRIRSLVNKAFTPRVVESLRGRIQAIVDEALDRVQARGRMELIADLAYPLPVAVIAVMLGIPGADRERFKHWSDAVSALLNSLGELTPEQLQKGMAARKEFEVYLGEIIEQRRARPQDDLLTALVQAEEAGDRLTKAEVFSNALLLLAAGHETTTNLIGNGMLALLRHPEQWRKLRDNPALLPQAIEELLRYDSPVQLTTRIATEDLSLGGTAIAKGHFVWVVLAAGNRDPGHFPDPDRLDVTRTDVKHFSFGAGPHYCLGAPLARLEGQLAIGTLAQRFPNLRLEPESVRYHNHFTLRGVVSLPLAF